MLFKYTCLPDLPKLAWCAQVDMKRSIVTVSHGRFVETHEHFFVEGIWNSAFEAGKFHQTECIFGSGAVLDGQTLTFVPSGTTLDALYYGRTSDHLTVSNSLPLLLAYVDDRLDPLFLEYATINRSLKDGIIDYEREIPTQRSAVRRLVFNNLHVCRDSVSESPKPFPPKFDCYNTYRTYLAENIKRLLENTRSIRRSYRVAVMSTQSRGYDSTAINSLAASFGLDKVFTSPASKEAASFFLEPGQKTQENDDGSPICDLLGLECIKIDRRNFLIDQDYELLFHAGLHENQDINLQEIFQYLTGATVLLTGVLGERWYKTGSIPLRKLNTVDAELKKWDLSGSGLSEVRLHVGMIQVAIPYLGARRWPEITKISDSPEMASWRLECQYDRPIPRRISEEAGIPRGMFGQKKLASVVDFPIPSFPYNKNLRRAFLLYLREQGLLGRLSSRLTPLVHRINNYISWNNPERFFTDYRRYPITYYLGRAYSKLSGRNIRFKPFWSRLDGSLFSYCVNEVTRQNQAVIKTARNKPEQTN